MTLGLCNALVAVFPWSADYVCEYSAEMHRLQTLSGMSGTHFEHIGSTAIPDMVAKPIIDIMITVDDIERQASVASALVKGGYSCLGECGRQDRLFLVRGTSPCLTTHHIHLVLEGSLYQENHLTIRDSFTTNSLLAHEYAILKIRLATEYPMSRMMYRFYKGAFITEQVLQKNIG